MEQAGAGLHDAAALTSSAKRSNDSAPAYIWPLMMKLGVDPFSLSLEEFERMIQAELESNARLVKAAGIKAN